MKQLFLMVNDGHVELLDTPTPTIKDGYVLVQSFYTAVSAGTESGLASFGEKNLIQKALERPDQVKKVLDKMAGDGIFTALDASFNKLKEPMPMGYSGVGRVIGMGKGVTDLQIGDMVAIAGQAYHSEVNRVNRNLVVKVPADFKEYEQCALCALGGIALEGIHQAKVVSGETVAVVGMGLLGHIVSRTLNAYGCDVIGFDVKDKTLDGTKLLAFIESTDGQAAEMTKSLTKGRGVDKVIITAATSSNAPMDLAASIVRDRGTICMIGVTRMNIDRRLYYEKELTFTIARSYGPGRYDSDYEEKGFDYPIGYVRFTEGRNIEEFIRLIVSKRLNLTDLITHVIDFEKAAAAYEMITTNKENKRFIAVLLKYNSKSDVDHHIVKIRELVSCDKKRIGVGIIGAGNFVRATMLPALSKTNHFELVGLCTTGGINAAQANHMYPFQYMTNQYQDIIRDSNIDLVIISTGHNSHAEFVQKALAAGKHVYCEKPLCLTLNQLEQIEEIYKKENLELFCGLNRRHAPLVEKLKKMARTSDIPAIYEYVVNAGYIPEKHWTQDEVVGGGRIIGEVCHFIDTLQFLDGSRLSDLKITYAYNNAYPKGDNCTLTLTFESGAVGMIIYTSMGSKRYPKEQIKVFTNGSVYELTNYVSLTNYGSSKKTYTKLKQDKGVVAEYEFIYDVIKRGKANTTVQDFLLNHRLLMENLKKVKHED